jgi:apolipoprotein N-acyltransferase
MSITANKPATITYPQADRWTYLWLVLGVILLTVSTGQFRVAFAAWLAPAFLIRYLRTQKTGKGYLLTLLGLYVAYAISWQAILGFIGPLPVFLIFNIFITLMNSLPYLADRLLVPHLKGFAATLVYPLAVTGIYYLYNLNSPIGSFGTPGYEQFSNLALVQLVSITGLWGLTFLVSWCGSVINWIWERSFVWAEVRRGLLIFAGIVGIVLLFGSLRLALGRPPAGTVRVHGFSREKDQKVEFGDMATDMAGFRRASQAQNDLLIEGTLREAQRGAQIVLWSEMAAGGVEEDVNALIARARQVASQEGIYLVMGIKNLYPGQDRPWENKLVVIDPSGEVIIDHDKYGATLLYSMMGDGEALQGEYTLKTASTPYGILTGVVCWDADFPATMRQAGKSNADILFVANGDPEGATATGQLHALQHIFRAIENGVSLVRQDGHSGLSVATDPYGRTLALVDLANTSQRVMVAQVPTRGVFTLYSMIGDLFGWLAVFGFVFIAGWAIYQARKTNAEAS